MEEEKDDYKIDLWETLLRNVMMIPFGVLIIAYVLGFTRMMNTLEQEPTRLIASMVFVFSFVKLVMWMGLPSICLRNRREFNE